jgi:hypothetical protein
MRWIRFVLIAALLGGCTTGPGDDEARARLVELAHREAGSYYAPYRELAEVLPNVRWRRDDGGAPEAASDLVVLGRIVAVDEGAAFDERGGPAPEGPGAREVAFDDETADWRTLELEVEVDRTIAGDDVDRVRAGFPVLGSTADARTAAAGLRTFGQVVLFLAEGSPVYAYDPTLLAVVHRGQLIATVDDAGRLALPLMEIPRFQGRVRTVADLESEARRPERVEDPPPFAPR